MNKQLHSQLDIIATKEIIMKYIAALLSLLPATMISTAQADTSSATKHIDKTQGSGNVTIIRQSGGRGNKVTINQSGSHNVADVFQEGQNNRADITQEGTKNHLNATQTGENNELTRKQTGHSITTINQNGEVSTHEHNGTVTEAH